MKLQSPSQRWNTLFFVSACLAYATLAVTAPRSSNPHQLSPIVIMVLSLTILGLLFLAWVFGFYAWLQLDHYTRRLPDGANQRAFSQITRGIWFLAAGLILSSLTSATKPFYANDIGLVAVITQINYYIIITFPFFGFLWLRIGSRHLSVLAQTAMTIRAKLITVSPLVVLLAVFYSSLAATNAAPDAQILFAGPTRPLILLLNITLVVGSWVLGLLAALNIERATHQGKSPELAQPLIKLYNGILTVTGGFIILDALMSLGTTRLSALPFSLIIALIYTFIGVVALGFLIVARSARGLIATLPAKAKTGA